MASDTSLERRLLSYRITGQQSIKRIEPLLKTQLCCDWQLANDSISSVHFVWETSCKIIERVQHLESVILNKLHNSFIIEDKSNLAYLQLIVSKYSLCNVLETYIAIGLCGVTKWASNRWEPTKSNGTSVDRSIKTDGCSLSPLLDQHDEPLAVTIPMIPNSYDWWIVKASRGNCGQDIWIFHAYNYKDVLPQLPPHTGDSHALNVVRCNSSK